MQWVLKADYCLNVISKIDGRNVIQQEAGEEIKMDIRLGFKKQLDDCNGISYLHLRIVESHV
jgi:hypothetical protein